MATHLNNLNVLFTRYKAWVRANPQLVSDVETTAKWVSYFVAGRISNSSIVSELIYSLSNILVLLNDRIIENSDSSVWKRGNAHRIKVFLTALEYCEVFIELSAKKLWGETGRWLLITIVQIVKFAERFILLKRYSEDIIRVPPISTLNRRKLDEVPAEESADDLVMSKNEFYFKLKRSGRVIRKIEGAPPLHLRSWKPLDSELNDNAGHINGLSKAEILYISKPLIHLGAVRLFGYNSWRSYSIALLCDLISIRMYYNNRHLLSKRQKIELSRRSVNLLLYFMRSPFYEKSTERRLMSLLTAIGNNIPLTKMICTPIMQYIPQWQSTYFYMWST